MLEPGEIPQSPNRPYSDAKRPREDGVEEPAPKRQGGAQEVVFRVVVPSRQIGKVIGKQGCRISKIRNDSKATVKIADPVARHEERVIIISSKESDSPVSEAENALQRIATLILEEEDGGNEASKVNGGHVAANMIQLLIAGSQAGSLIGVSGQNIEKLRVSSGATIVILAPNQLPSCASAHESDRVVQISGDVLAVLKALEEIGAQLRENPPRKVISVSPMKTHLKVRPPQPLDGQVAADYVTFEMVISEAMVGALIGRNGSNISRIRAESEATIKVYGGKGEQNQRQIWFAGSLQQVELAKRMVNEFVSSQLLQADALHPVTTLPRQSSRFS